MQIAGKHERSDAIKKIKHDLTESMSPEEQETRKGEVKDIFHDLEKDVVRNLVLDKQYRVDGRGLADVRPISIMTVTYHEYTVPLFLLAARPRLLLQPPWELLRTSNG